jgi:hypothetical protein
MSDLDVRPPRWKEVLAHPGYRELLEDLESPLAQRRSAVERQLLGRTGEIDPYQLGLLRGELAAYSWMSPDLLTRFDSPQDVGGGDLHRLPRVPYLPRER